MVSGFEFKGVPAGDYRNDRIKTAVKLYEENLIFDETGFNRTGRKDENYHVSRPMHMKQLVKLHPDSGKSEQIIVQPASGRDAQGRIITYPHIRADIGWNDDELDSLPMENAQWGDYTPRSATVEWFATTIDQFRVKAENEEILPGNYITFDLGNEFAYKSSEPTNWIAMEKIEALHAGWVRALALK